MVEAVDQSIKDALNEQYDRLDPVTLLEKLKKLQSKLFEYAWCSNVIQEETDPLTVLSDFIGKSEPKKASNDIKNGDQYIESEKVELHHYRHTKKTSINKRPRDWRTRKDPFENVWDEIKLKLELNPEQTAKALLDGLITKYPADYKTCHLRTLQRRVLRWRSSQLDQEARLRTIMRPNDTSIY
jgi:hypothetical protein